MGIGYIVREKDGRIRSVESEHKGAHHLAGLIDGTVETRRDWHDFETAERVAAELTALSGGVRLHIGVDRGAYVSPRYDVIEAPKVGDAVSYAFNGDYYPDGVITRISDSLRVITTSSGKRYWRRKKTASWMQTGGTWTLIQGHHDRRNPHF